MSLTPTPSQTVGPFFSFALADGFFPNELVPLGSPGAIRIRGQVLDGKRKPVPDALVEIWQRPSEEVPGGFARSGTDAQGWFEFVTVKPAPVEVNGRLQAPHLAVTVFMRGLLKQLLTRMYFPEEAANEADPVLKRVPADRRHTLIARRGADDALHWNIVLQGEDETVFFDF